MEIRSWNLHLRSDKTIEDLSRMFNPVIRGWLQYYGRFYRSELYPLLARINFHIQQWAQAKYRRLRPHKALLAAWERVTGQYPGLFPQWRWVTWSWR